MMQRDLRDYIVKLNDRNIQRQRETGFTLYAILGSIIYCVFYLIENVGILMLISNNSGFLCAATFISNLVFVFSLLYISYVTATRRQPLTKIFPYKQPFKIEIIDYPFFVSCLTICVLNFLSIKYSQNLIHEIFLIIFFTLTLLNICSPFVINIYRLIKRNKKKRKGLSIEEFDFTFFNKTIIRIFSISSLIYGTILLVFWCITAFLTQFDLGASTIVSISKYIVIYFGLLYLMKKAMDVRSKSHENNQLEDFEKEIFFENMSNEEIAKKFEVDFVGIPFSKWVVEKQNEFIEFFDGKRNVFLEQNVLINSLDGLDKTVTPYEYTGRLKNIIDISSVTLKETKDFVQRISVAFKNLKQFSSLNEVEVDQLNKVQDSLNENINDFNSKYSALLKNIKERK